MTNRKPEHTEPHEAGTLPRCASRTRAGARARTEERLDPTLWIDTFPSGVGAYLIECRLRGMSFDEAWTRDLDRMARDAGFTWKQKPGTVEVSLRFAKRHFRSFYENARPGAPNCCVIDCHEVAVDEFALCATHGYYE